METVLPILLVGILVGFGNLVFRAVKRRHDFVTAEPGASEILPDLTTKIVLSGSIRRLWLDKDQGLPLVEFGLGELKLIFCPVDHAANAENYKQMMGKSGRVHLFGLATLHPGGAETMAGAGLIKNAEAVAQNPELVTLEQAGQFPNDYVAIGHILDRRRHDWAGTPLAVFQLRVSDRVAPPLTLELGVPEELAPALSDATYAHGNVRLFGYLATDND